MQIGTYLGMLHGSEAELARAFRFVAKQHAAEPDIEHECTLFGSWCDEHVLKLQPFVQQDGEGSRDLGMMRFLFRDAAALAHEGSRMLVTLRHLHHLWLMAQESHISWLIIEQAAQGLRNESLELTCQEAQRRNHLQVSWLKSRIKQSAPQTLIVSGTAGPTVLVP